LGGDPNQGASEVHEATAILVDLSAGSPAMRKYRQYLELAHQLNAAIHSGVGNETMWFPHGEDLAMAEEAARAELSNAELWVKRNPGRPSGTQALARALDDLAVIVTERDPRRALPLFERALTVVPDWEGKESIERTIRCTMAISLATLGRRADALAASATGIAMADKEPEGPRWVARLAPSMCRFQAARARRALGDREAAADLFAQTADGLRPVIAERPRIMLSYVGLVETLGQLATLRPAQRCALLDEAASAWRSWPGTPTPYTRRRQAELDAARTACR
jgi:hypothetical protein